MKKTRAKSKQPKLISHHSNTGKRLPKQYTSYPLLIFILLLVGVFMAGLTFKARASDISVHAFIQAPLPTIPATIVTPIDGAHLSDSLTTINGSCEATDMVKLYRNDNFSGAVLCAADGTFQIQTALFVGANDLHARIFNVTYDEGPQSPIVRVYYDPSSAPGVPASTGDNTPVQTTPSNSTPEYRAAAPVVEPQFMINSDNFYKGYVVGDTIEWQLNAFGGTPPYALSVNWGDGETTIVSRKDAGIFTVKHVYKKAGGYKGSYAIKITASDANDTSTFLQLMVIIQDKSASSHATPGIASIEGLPPTINLPFDMQYFWPAYGVTFLMAASFWLGQRRTLVTLRPRRKQHAH